MPIVFSARLDGSEATRYEYFPLAGLYLRISQEHAVSALASSSDPPQTLRHIVIAIAFSAMSVEALANELAADIIDKADLEDFDWVRSPFDKRTAPGKSPVTKKLAILLAKKNHPPLTASMLESMDALVDARNKLVHYKLVNAATRAQLPPAQVALDTGSESGSWTFDLRSEPVSVHPGLVPRLGAQDAADAYNSAYDFFLHWHTLERCPDAMELFSRLAQRNT